MATFEKAGYAGFLFVLGAAFVFVTRSIKTKYNEEQVIALSIYNLTFVGMVKEIHMRPGSSFWRDICNALHQLVVSCNLPWEC